jgi:hypothetical protein
MPMQIFRRFATLCAMGWWLGGLTFYSLVVIRAAHQIVGSHAKVGFITQKATMALNVIGAGALILMLWNGLASWRPSGSWIRKGLAASWVVAAAAHAWVFLLHAHLDAMLDFKARQVQEGVSFHGPHETYLIATSIEWVTSLVYLLAALAAWRQEDTVSSDRK